MSGVAHADNKTTLLVYTAIETDAMKLYKDGFEKAYPNIEIRWVRDSTGVVTSKLLAEKIIRKQTSCWGWLQLAWCC